MLLPLLSGIFGASSLLLSLSTDTEIPEQEESGDQDACPQLRRRGLLRQPGGLGGGLDSRRLAICGRAGRALGAPSSAEEFLVSIAGVNSANALFSLVALYVIGKPRSGAAAAIQELMDLDQSASGADDDSSDNSGCSILSGGHRLRAPGGAGHLAAELPAALRG